MSNIVEEVVIHDFKRIKSLTLEVDPITVLIGGNTSGKSSVLQAVQLATALIQSAKTEKTYGLPFAKTLSNEQITFRPTEDLLELRHGTPATQNSGFGVAFSFSVPDSEDLAAFEIGVTRGKNANLSLTFAHNSRWAEMIADREKVFSILVPGLSGIALREEWRTRGALDQAAMHGDANLYLRTLLAHLHAEQAKWKTFSDLLKLCYEDIRLTISHNDKTDRYVDVYANIKGKTVRLDLASTGVLQVVQILAYACLYEPHLLLLDEPDAHLHPDSQTKLYEAINAIAERVGTKIILATHSTHIMKLAYNGPNASVVWMKDGAEVESPDHMSGLVPLMSELGLLETGADFFAGHYKLVVLTEDENQKYLKTILEASGVNIGETLVLSYNGSGNLSGARMLAAILSQHSPNTVFLIHRDRDFRTDDEMALEGLIFDAWARANIGDSGNILEFFTSLNDLEHWLCQADQLARVLNRPENDMIELVQAAAQHGAPKHIAKAVKSRQVIARALYGDNHRDKRDVLGMSHNAPSDNQWVPPDGNAPLNIGNCYGKKLLGDVITRLGETEMARGVLRATLLRPENAAPEPSIVTLAQEIWPPE